MPHLNSKDINDFSSLEKEALKEISLDIIKVDLQKSLSELHQKNMKEVGEKISAIEGRCTQEIKTGLEAQIQRQLDAHFKRLLESYQSDISKTLSPLMKKAESDIQRLDHAVNQITTLCETVRKQYAFWWEKPFFVLILSASLVGAIVGFVLLFLQIPFVSVLLMDAHTRKAYEMGARLMDYDQKLKALPTKPTASPSEKKLSKKKKKPSKG